MKHKGFTLVEFSVIISIFAVMASVALFNFNGFRSSVGLNNLAHDIGLTIRQAQVFGWVTQSSEVSGVLELSTGDPLTGNPVRYANGVYFPTATSSGTNPQFVLYQKADPRGLQNYVNTVDTIIDTVTINGPYTVETVLYGDTKSDLEITSAGMVPTAGGVSPITDVSIAFSRPNPEAQFFTGATPVTARYVAIYVRNSSDPAGTARHVVIVSRSGEIDVQ